MKIRNLKILPSMVVLFFCMFCSKNKITTSGILGDSRPGMIKICSLGKTLHQGNNDTLASDDERPGITVTFSYDYYIDTVEVTQLSFTNLMHRNPSAALSSASISVPISNVTWYDAVLYCNARSVSERRDTVYRYVEINRDSSGAVVDLGGLVTDYAIDGYRLPTESEWEFAARGALDELPFQLSGDSTAATQQCWFSANASGVPHAVATRTANRLGLYDMGGNLFEWVNDWQMAYPPVPKTITNCIGSATPNDRFEKVVKGGSYRHGFAYLRPSRRNANYPTVVAQSDDYVGFRCACGPIPEPRYLTSDTLAVVVQSPMIKTTVVQNIFGTSEVKIVFVLVSGLKRILCRVDYSGSHAFVHQFTDTVPVHTPSISPNGKWVVYATNGEGVGGRSQLRIRALDSLNAPSRALGIDSGFIPRWWVDPTTSDTFIIYINSAVANMHPAWSQGKTYKLKFEHGKPSSDPIVIVQNGSFHDGLSADGAYIVTGYTNLLMRAISTGETRRLFLPPFNGKDSSGSTQVCNVSMAPDNSSLPKCLFIDFGSSLASKLTGSSYGIHQYLFIADYNGTTIWWKDVPANESEWDYPEWSNQSGFAVACTRDKFGSSHSIYTIDINADTAIKMLEGREIETPALWIRSSAIAGSSVSADSAGAYDYPHINDSQASLFTKMNIFWTFRDSAEYVFLGSSQVTAGIDPAQFTGHLTINLGFNGGGSKSVVRMITDYVIPQCKKVKVVGIGTTPYWLGDKGGDLYWDNGFSRSKGYIYDMNHGFWAGGAPSAFVQEVQNKVGWDPIVVRWMGNAKDTCGGWRGYPPECGGRTDWTIQSTEYIQNFAQIKHAIESLTSLKIHVLLINFPESPFYRQTPQYGRGGPTWETGKAIMEQYKALCQSNPYCHFYDAYLDGNHDYADPDAFNYNHLCPVGAEKLSKRVDSLITTFIQ